MRAFFHLRITLASAAAAMVVACGGGGDGNDDASRYMPLSVGNAWVYEVRGAALGNDSVLSYFQRWEASETADLDGAEGVAISTRDTDDGLAGSLAFATRDETVLRLSDATWIPAMAALGPVEILRLPVFDDKGQVVDSRTGLDGGSDLDGDGINETMAVRTVLRSEGEEDVEVPAGRFEGTLRIQMTTRTTLTSSSTGVEIGSSQWRETFWFAKDVGIVRSQLAWTDGSSNSLESRELVAYTIDGTRGGDVEAPAVVQFSPESGTTVRGDASVRLAFGDAIDRVTVESGGFSLQDSEGNAVDGYFSWADDRSFYFVPYSNLPDGRYTATLTTVVSDVAGNPLGTPTTWSFDAETIRPMIVARSPGPDEVDVPVDVKLSIRFDRALDPTWVDSSTFQLWSLTDGFTTTTVSLSEDGQEVTIVPDTALVPGGVYSVDLQYWIQDREGNQLGEYVSWLFTTASDAMRSMEQAKAVQLTPAQHKLQQRTKLPRR